MSLYADYDYYTNDFYEPLSDCVIPSGERAVFLKKASAFLDSLFVHGKPSEPYPEEVKNACCEIAECIYIYSKREGISAESNDGYSVTYSYRGGNSAGGEKAYAIALRYLANTGLLYRGIG